MFELLRTLSHGQDLAFGPFADVVRARPPFLPTLAAPTLAAVPADVVETVDELRVILDLPGIAADGVSVKYENDVLAIEAERKVDEVKGGTHLLSERGFGKLRRAFTVNVPIDADAIAARYDQGVLTVTLPKRAEAKPRRIDVKVK